MRYINYRCESCLFESGVYKRSGEEVADSMQCEKCDGEMKQFNYARHSRWRYCDAKFQMDVSGRKSRL